jgi:RNA polymerase sigma-70 factor (ECF subfamily)
MPDTSHDGAPDLRALLSAVARGDAAAFEQLYRATSAKLFGICLRVLSQRGDAEEVLQDVFTTIWHKAGQYDAARANPLVWLGMLARNRAIDRLRASTHERHAVPVSLAEDLSDDAPSTFAMAESSDQRRRLESCMNQLEAPRRTLIRTAFFDGATYEELARRCGSPLGTVKSWIRRGLAQLKLCLEQ